MHVTLSDIMSLFSNFLELGLASLLAKPVLSSLVVALSAPLRTKRESFFILKICGIALSVLEKKNILCVHTLSACLSCLVHE